MSATRSHVAAVASRLPTALVAGLAAVGPCVVLCVALCWPSAIYAQLPRAATPQQATLRKLAGAIDQYQREVVAAEKAAERAKAAAGEKLLTTYEAAIKRAMKAGDLRGLEELQAELKVVREEVGKGGSESQDDTGFKTNIMAHPWVLYWDAKHYATYTFHADGTVTRLDRPGTWQARWVVDKRPTLVLDGNDILLLSPNGRLYGFHPDTGKPVSGFSPREPLVRQ